VVPETNTHSPETTAREYPICDSKVDPDEMSLRIPSGYSRNPLPSRALAGDGGGMADHKEPTDHLPPADEREPDDERTTAGAPHPDVVPPEGGGVSEATAAEPDEPRVHGMEKPPRSQF
jgi:hypothetical protein